MILNKIIPSIALLAVLGVFSCKQGETKQKEGIEEKTQVEYINPDELVTAETKLLLDYLDELGDYVNSRQFPSMIKPVSVFEGMEKNQLVIDIRSSEAFKKGHISGAENVPFEQIPNFFESSIVPFEYDKIILVSEGGQTSSYAACLLRLMGYGNVYSMRWGMSGWNSDFTKSGWLSQIGSKHQSKLETTTNAKAKHRVLPDLNAGKSTGEEILLHRVKKLFQEGLEEAHISADDVFAKPSTFYIMNYIRRDKYEAGHIPGAIRYKPQATLGIIKEMATIPSDKTSIVYCGTGHNSGFVTAYLRLFGFDARTLKYGNNSFMFDKMVAEQETLSWQPFTEDLVEDYPITK